MDAADVRRWIAGFEAADAAAAAASAAAGPQYERSVRLSLSLIEAARTAAGGRLPIHPHRETEDAVARATWVRLRARARA